MSSRNGPTESWRALRAVLPGGPSRRRLLITVAAALGLWLFASQRFSDPQPPKGEPNRAYMFRADANEIIAYPRSDAAMDYLNGMAILSGDGWVNWRDTNRWSVYRPGWGACLAGLALVTGGEPATMQSLLTFLLAAAAPLFMLLILHLYPGGRDLLLAVVAAMVFVVSPFQGWWFQRTMMSEGPTMLLSLLFCLLAIRFCGRLGGWSWRQGLLLGLVGGALSLVREQSRFAILAVVVLLVLASAGRLRRRLPFFVCMACGVLFLVAPLYLKTSIHLRMPYAGTSYFALHSVLRSTEIGRLAGGVQLPAGVELSEREATKLLQQRVRRGLVMGLSQPGKMLRDGFLQYSRFIYGAVSAAAKRYLPPPPKLKLADVKLLVYYVLAAAGLFFCWRRVGLVALAPLVFAAGYILPMVPFWFYLARFGAPISWVGLTYVAGSVLLLGGARAVAARKETEAGAGAGETSSAIWPGRRFFAVVGAWLILATAVLLWWDGRPLPEVDAARLLAAERSRELLTSAGIAVGPGLVEEAGRVLNHGAESESLLAGIAVFPMTVDPGDTPVPLPFGRRQQLVAGEESYQVFHLVSPWKRGNSFRISQVRVPVDRLAGLRHGEELLVLGVTDTVEPGDGNLVAQVSAAAALPTAWVD